MTPGSATCGMKVYLSEGLVGKLEDLVCTGDAELSRRPG